MGYKPRVQPIWGCYRRYATVPTDRAPTTITTFEITVGRGEQLERETLERIRAAEGVERLEDHRPLLNFDSYVTLSRFLSDRNRQLLAICTALTTSDLPANVEVGEAWVSGRHPERSSYCSPWVLATVKHRAIANPQGNLTTAFTDDMIEQSKSSLSP